MDPQDLKEQEYIIGITSHPYNTEEGKTTKFSQLLVFMNYGSFLLDYAREFQEMEVTCCCSRLVRNLLISLPLRKDKKKQYNPKSHFSPGQRTLIRKDII